MLTEWETEVLEKTEEFSIKLWQGYNNLITELMCNAQLVTDKIHVMAQVDKNLDAQMKQEKCYVKDLIKKAKSLFEKLNISSVCMA